MPPKAFLSYSWSSADHERWVIALATQLRENGVDVILDKWDLKEGHDAIAFMEKMVTDSEVNKVIVVLDRSYAEKADGRKGGVGTETQIISAEVYKKADQNKFVGVIAEKDEEGRPYLPTYYKSRIYIDLSDSDTYGANFDQLLRWIFDKPLNIKPELGKQPEFLTDRAINLGTQSRAHRVLSLLRSGSENARGALDDYFSTFVEGLEKLRITLASNDPSADDKIVENIEAFLPYRNEFVEVVGALARYWPFDVARELQKFFEGAAAYMFRSSSRTSSTDWDFDNFRFIVHEMFLYAIALLIKAERFEAVAELLGAGFYLGDAAEDTSEPIANFGIFRLFMRSLEARNQRLDLRRLSLRGDLLEKRSHSSGLSFRYLMQADFVLYLRSSVLAAASKMRQWWPETLVYATFRVRGPFEIFARAESRMYFKRICPMLSVQATDDLSAVIAKLGRDQNSRLFIPKWQFDTVDPAELANLAKLATTP
jgi:TIR domain